MTWVEDLAKVVDSISERVNLANWVTSLILLFFAYKLGGMIRLDLASMQELAKLAFDTFKELALLAAGYLLAKVNSNASV